MRGRMNPVSKRNFPVLDTETLDAIFVRVYGLTPQEEEAYPMIPPLSDFFPVIQSLANFNYRHRNNALREVYPIAREAIGEFEINSEGTSVWMSYILALKELYELSDKQLLKTLEKITVRK
jgi:hypothetical protein